MGRNSSTSASTRLTPVPTQRGLERQVECGVSLGDCQDSKVSPELIGTLAVSAALAGLIAAGKQDTDRRLSDMDRRLTNWAGAWHVSKACWRGSVYLAKPCLLPVIRPRVSQSRFLRRVGDRLWKASSSDGELRESSEFGSQTVHGFVSRRAERDQLTTGLDLRRSAALTLQGAW